MMGITKREAAMLYDEGMLTTEVARKIHSTRGR